MNDFYGVNEDEILRVTGANDLLTNDSDPDGDQLAVQLVSGPRNPLFDINTNGHFTYDARYHGDLYVNTVTMELTTMGDGDGVLLDEGFNSLAAGAVITDEFTYAAKDGQDEANATATITITGVNDDPVAANDDAGNVNQGGTIEDFNVLDNDSDVDVYPTPDILTIIRLTDIADDGGPAGGSDNTPGDGLSIVTDAGGTVTLDGTNIDYEAADDFFGIDTVEYEISDGNGGFDTAIIRFTVLPGNDDPTAVDDSYMVGEDAGATMFASVLGNDSDPDSEDDLGAQLGGLVLTRIDNPTDMNPIGGDPGILVDFNVDGTFTYNPNGQFEDLGDGESAYVAFEYDAFDAEGNPDRAKVIIEIQGANDPVQGNIPGQSDDVFEAGLSDGSTDGDTVIMRTFDFTADLMAASAGDPEGDAIFLTFVDNNGEGVLNPMAGDTMSGSTGLGTFELLDAFNNLTGAAGPDNLVDGVKYTLNTSTTHADVAGHNGGIFDLLNLGFTDGTENTGGTAYVLDFTGDGGTNNVTSAQVEVFDDIPLLNQLPDLAVGAGAADDLDNGSVDFIVDDMDSDTFSFIEGADGAMLHFTGKPADFDLIDGRTVTSNVSADGLTITGVDSEGDDFYTLELIDGTADDGEWTHKFTLLQGPPTVINPIDFSSVKAGGPMETLTVENIKFDGGFFDKDPDRMTEEEDIFDSFAQFLASGDDDINPNNAGGIGIGNGNIEQEEVLCIDVTGSLVPVTGLSFILQGNGGGVAGSVEVLWVAVKDGSIVDSGTETTTNINAAKTFDLDGDGKFETNGEEVFIEPSVAFDVIYVAINPDGDDPDGKNGPLEADPLGLDSSDSVRINRIATIQEQESPDIVLPFSVTGFEDLNDSIDGDETQEESFTWTINGPSADPDITPLEMDVDPFA